jgi:hypothetical protein
MPEVECRFLRQNTGNAAWKTEAETLKPAGHPITNVSTAPAPTQSMQSFDFRPSKPDKLTGLLLENPIL